MLKGIEACETLSVMLREGHVLRVFQNRVLRRIFQPQGGGSDGRLDKAA
jgi:hypothetical protein